MYPIHKKCGGQILLNLTPNIRLTTGIGITNSYLKPGMGDLELLCNTFPSEFYCTKCGKVENLEEILCNCSNCGGLFTLSELFKFKDAGGVYCKDCVGNLPDFGGTVCVEVIFKKVSIK